MGGILANRAGFEHVRAGYDSTVLVIGLTGGIGSGKSTVAGLLELRGATVIDVDALGRQVIAPDGRAEATVVKAFGPDIVDTAGHIDRNALAAVVFGRPDALGRLTEISHPAIDAEIDERLHDLPCDAIVVLDMAILVESVLGLGRYTRVVVVEAPADVRVERAVARGMQADDVRARMASQTTDARRRDVADVVLSNDGDLPTLSARVDELWTQIGEWDDLGRGV